MRRRTTKRRLGIAIGGLLILATATATATGNAAAPEGLNFQGFLTNSTGDPIDESALAMRFTLFAVPSGGSALWEEVQAVDVSGGVYSVILGSSTPLPPELPFSSQYYLELAIDGDGSGIFEPGEELAPRQPLTSVPYALHANEASVNTQKRP